MDDAILLHNAVAGVTQAYGAQIARLTTTIDKERAFAKAEIERLKAQVSKLEHEGVALRTESSMMREKLERAVKDVAAIGEAKIAELEGQVEHLKARIRSETVDG